MYAFLVFGLISKLSLSFIMKLSPDQRNRIGAVETAKKEMKFIVARPRAKAASPRTKAMIFFNVPAGKEALAYSKNPKLRKDHTNSTNATTTRQLV